MCLFACLSIVGCLAVRFTCSTFSAGTRISELRNVIFNVSENPLVSVPAFEMSLFIRVCATSIIAKLI